MKMKPYGVRVIESPNVAEIQEMGAKSSAGKIKGNQHGYTRSSANKRSTRRYWKRRARREGAATCIDD